MEDKEKRNARQRELMRKRRNANKSVSDANQNANATLTANKTLTDEEMTDAETLNALCGDMMEMQQRVKLLEESVAKLAASQARVSVVPGSTLKPKAAPKNGDFSVEAQAKGQMINRSPLGRMFSEQNDD